MCKCVVFSLAEAGHGFADAGRGFARVLTHHHHHHHYS